MGMRYDMSGEGEGILSTVKGPSLPTVCHTYNVRFIKLTRISRKWMHQVFQVLYWKIWELLAGVREEIRREIGILQVCVSENVCIFHLLQKTNATYTPTQVTLSRCV